MSLTKQHPSYRNTNAKQYKQLGPGQLFVLTILFLLFIIGPSYWYISSLPAEQALSWYNYLLLLLIAVAALFFAYGLLMVYYIIAAVQHDSKTREAILTAIEKKYNKIKKVKE